MRAAGICVAQRRRHRDGVDDVAQRAEPDDEKLRCRPGRNLRQRARSQPRAIRARRSRVEWSFGSPTMAVRPP